MPRPTTGTTLQRPDLGEKAMEYYLEASQRGFIGTSILPIKNVPRQSADYPIIPIEAMLKLFDTKRAPRGNYNRSDYEFKTGTYACEEYGWEELVDDAERNLYVNYFSCDEIATMRSVDQILRNQEKRIADMLFNSAIITGTFNVVIPWNTPATCIPREDVQQGKTAMRAVSGLEPNVLVMSKKVFDQLCLAKQITDCFRYTSPFEVGTEEGKRRILAQFFGIDQVLVGNSIRDTAKKGQTKVLADMWDDEYVGLFKVARSDDMKDPCIGRTFLWTEDSPSNLITEQYREEQRRADVFRCRHNVEEALVFAGAGYLVGNIIHP